MKKAFIYIGLLLLSAGRIIAQTDVQSTGILYVSTGTDTLYITGAFTNTSAAALTNNGRLYVKQNLTNGQASMAVGTGILILNGTSNQTVAGAQPFKTFNLITDNTAGFTLNANLDVSGAHTFTNGVIATSVTPNYLIYQAGASYSGAADGRNVNGWVKKFGNTNFTFPVGNGTYLRDVALNSISSSSEFNVKYSGSTPNTSNVTAPIMLVDANEYWSIVKVSGGSAQVAMNWNNSKVPFPNYVLTAIRATWYNGAFWTDQGGSASGNILTTGNITSNSVSSFGSFTFGSIDFYLSMQFVSLHATRNAGYNLVQWKTADESNVRHYNIERSFDASLFSSIGTVAAIGGGDYTFRDMSPSEKTTWYRIRGVDNDGKTKYSPVVMVAGLSSSPIFEVAGNVVSRYIHIMASVEYKGNYEYSIVNAAGQVLQKGNLSIANAGISSIEVNSAVGHGVYFLNIQNAQHRLAAKVNVR